MDRTMANEILNRRRKHWRQMVGGDGINGRGPCICCGDLSRVNNFICESCWDKKPQHFHTFEEWIASTPGPKELWFNEELCPKCEHNLPEENDYLCEECRYG
jgi:hypothetical protein